jgi:LSD1 subclass zinc finger protein
MSQVFERINFIRDEMHQLQAVTAYCVKCHEERAPIVTPEGWGAIRMRCPICQSVSTVIIAEHDESPNAWS